MRAGAPLAAALAALFAAASCGGGDGDRAAVPTTPARPPADFIGMVTEDTFHGSADYRARSLRRQRAVGVRLLRQPFRWREVERAPGRYDFARLDAFVSAAARRRLRILPILIDPPAFRSSAPRTAARPAIYPPRDPGALGRFAAVLVRRYGPKGSFWDRSRLPRLPIRSWQVWNEPNLPAYWASGPDPAGYARLLRETAPALRRADPHAEIVAAGLSQTRLGMPFAKFVEGMYRGGAAESFDTFALHPYARSAAGVLESVEDTRDLLGSQDDSPPIWVTEFGWASGGPASPFTVGEREQARLVEAAMGGLGRRRRELGIRGAVHYQWRDGRPPRRADDFFGWHTGLLRVDDEPKPALRAFERAARGLR